MWNNIQRIDEVLQTFRHNYKELTLIIHKQEKQIQFLETKALYLSMFYIGFQLIMLRYMSSEPSAYQCRNWWKPFFVSLSIAVAFGLNFGTTVIKYVRTKYEQDRNFIDQEENYHQMACLERKGAKIREGPDESTNMEFDFSKEYIQQKPDMFAVYKRYVHLGITIFALLAFTVLVLHTCRSSVCADGVN